MIEREYILTLYETYNKLLTEREKNYFEYYYFEDYSMQEIADLYEVSKAYASKYLNQIVSKLEKYESLLELNKKSVKIKELIKDLPEDIKNKIDELL